MTTTARVRITLEIDCGSNWNDAVTAEQVFKQAEEETLAALESVFHQSRLRPRYIGKPDVFMVVAKKEK